MPLLDILKMVIGLEVLEMVIIRIYRKLIKLREKKKRVFQNFMKNRF